MTERMNRVPPQSAVRQGFIYFTLIAVVLLTTSGTCGQNITPRGPDPRSLPKRPFVKTEPPVLIMEVVLFKAEAMSPAAEERASRLRAEISQQPDPAAKKELENSLDELLKYHESTAAWTVSGFGYGLKGGEDRPRTARGQFVLTVNAHNRKDIHDLKDGDFVRTVDPLPGEGTPTQLMATHRVTKIARPEWWPVETSLPVPTPHDSRAKPIHPELVDDWAEKYEFHAAAQPADANSSVAPVDMIDHALPAVFEVQTASGHGTGFLINADGVAITNRHVIDDARIFRAKFADGRMINGDVIGVRYDADLALLQLDGSDHPFLTLLSTEQIRPGEQLFVIGSPREFSHSVSAGIVSAVRIESGIRHVQTDAAVNLGNSGGPVLNAHGYVVGIATWKRVASEGLNFAICADEAIKRLPLLPAKTNITRSDQP